MAHSAAVNTMKHKSLYGLSLSVHHRKNNNNNTTYKTVKQQNCLLLNNKLATKTIVTLFIASYLIVQASHQQSTISLNTAQWFVSNSNGSLVLPAQVPGGIYSDLRRNNVLKQELLFGKNDLAYRWVGQENWTYTTSFAIDQQIAMSQAVKLVLHGIDTVATLYLNGEEIGTTDNMFVRYKFDVKPYLKLAGLKNILAIRIESPIKYASRRSHQSLRNNRGKIIPPYCPSPAQRGECHVNFIRKMQASFSWDWGPAFPSMGIYKNIELEYGSFGLIRDILVETRRLTPLVQPGRDQSHAPPQVIISSTIKHNVRVPTVDKTVPYVRAPPYFLPPFSSKRGGESSTPTNGEFIASGGGGQQAQHLARDRESLGESNQSQLLEENWLLKITLVAEMVQASFGYNVRVEFNLNGVLHYESEHINVVANSDGYIRLGFNLRIDSSRMRVRPWWPNNAGEQPLYKLTARIMPIPSAPDRIQLHQAAAALPLPLSQPFDSLAERNNNNNNSSSSSSSSSLSLLQARAKPLQTPAVPPMIFLATQPGVSLHQIQQQISEKEISFGFRTVELIQEPVTRANLDDGLTFAFRINGIDLFAMGSNWIPASVLPENSNDLEYIRYLLQSAKDANMNMLRVWGGGLYESDEFYRMADEMGIMIWHDFMFACALYPIDDDFIASVRLEIEQQVQRLQHHPSIVLWAGNNENEMAIAGPWWPEVMVWNKKLRENYSKLYVDTIRPIVQILDPTRPYLASSPSNGLMSESQPNAISRLPNDNKYGDVHHYDYLTDSFDWSVYPSTRFASEYGFQSYPSFNAITSSSSQNDWKYPLTANLLHRQHRLTGETEMKLQLKVHFNELKTGGVDKLKTFIYVSQLAQAIAIKTETEFYRRNRFIDSETKLGKTMGALYWQLNDVWQAPTWSSIEYGGKWKMLHYFARRFFFPIQVMPYLTQGPSSFSSSLSTNGGGGGSSALGYSIQQQLFSIGGSGGSSILSSLSNNRLPSVSTQQQQQQQHQQQQQSPYSDTMQQPMQQQQQQQQQQSSSSLFVIDLVRDDMFDILDSFNVTIRFFRWTSFVPVWQDTVYVRNTRPRNVTRIYEQDIARIVRQPGVISLSSGAFQVVIEQQTRFGLSQIENYLMPVAPNRVTAMRVAKINVELIQGPFELTDVGQAPDSSTQWSCAYRITLVSDSVAMFVWLDLNLLNSGSQTESQPAGPPQQQTSTSGGGGGGGGGGNNNPLEPQVSGSSQQSQQQRPPSAPNNIHLNSLPFRDEDASSLSSSSSQAALAAQLPGHIRLHLDHDREATANSGGNINRDDFSSSSNDPLQSSASVSIDARSLNSSNYSPLGVSLASYAEAMQQKQRHKRLDHETVSAWHALPEIERKKRQIDELPRQNKQHPNLPERLIINMNNNNNNENTGSGGYGSSNDEAYANWDRERQRLRQQQQSQQQQQQKQQQRQQQQAQFKPVDASGGSMLRYQFSDNAFNMFEPSRVIDLYLSRCLTRAQIELALEIQSLADCL